MVTSASRRPVSLHVLFCPSQPVPQDSLPFHDQHVFYACVCFYQGVRGELLKLSGSLLLVYGTDVPELIGGVDTMLGWCDYTLDQNAEGKKVILGVHTKTRDEVSCWECAGKPSDDVYSWNLKHLLQARFRL